MNVQRPRAISAPTTKCAYINQERTRKEQQHTAWPEYAQSVEGTHKRSMVLQNIVWTVYIYSYHRGCWHPREFAHNMCVHTTVAYCFILYFIFYVIHFAYTKGPDHRIEKWVREKKWMEYVFGLGVEIVSKWYFQNQQACETFMPKQQRLQRTQNKNKKNLHVLFWMRIEMENWTEQ